MPLEGLPGTPEEKSAATLEQLRELPGQKRALVLMNSHIGGHKFVGNVIVSFLPSFLLSSSFWSCLLIQITSTGADIHTARIGSVVRTRDDA